MRGAIHAHQNHTAALAIKQDDWMDTTLCSIACMLVCSTTGSANICINHSISVSQTAGVSEQFWYASQAAELANKNNPIGSRQC